MAAVVHQGEELGLPNAELAYGQLRDPFGLRYWPMFRGRDGSRTPMPWQAALPHAGFTTGQPWLPVPDAHLSLAADRQAAEGNTLLAMTRGLLQLRQRHPALARGQQVAREMAPPLVGFERHCDGERIACLFNLSAETVAAPADWLQGAIPLWPVPGAPLADVLALPPWGVVFARLAGAAPAGAGD